MGGQELDNELFRFKQELKAKKKGHGIMACPFCGEGEVTWSVTTVDKSTHMSAVCSTKYCITIKE